MTNFNWCSHADVTNDAIEVAQQEMARCLALAGMKSEIVEHGPTLRLTSKFCQRRAALKRVWAEKQALVRLQACWTPGKQLIAMHRVIPTTPDHSPTYALTHHAVSAAFTWLADCPRKAMSRGRRIKVVVGCYEPDHIVDERGHRWQGSIHAVGMVKASTFEEVHALVHELYRTPSSHDVYRPLVCKEVTDLPGAIQYAFKSMQFGSITTRSRWSCANRRHAQKFLLKAPARNELVRSMADVQPSDRTVSLTA